MGKFAFAAVWLLVFVIPWENQLAIPGLGTLSRIVGLGAMGLGILSLGFGQRALRLHGFHLAMVFFTVLGGVSFFWSSSPENSLTRFITYLQMLGMTWLIFQAAEGPQRVKSLLAAYVAGACVALGSVFWEFSSGVEDMRRFSAQGFNPNDLAVILALGIPMGWYLAESRWGGRLAWLFRLYPLVAPLGILLTASRNGLLALGLTLIYPLFSLLYASWWKKASVLLLLWGALAGAWHLVPSLTMERLATFDEALAGGLNARQDIWAAGLKAFAEHPLLGWGAGSFPETVEPFYGLPAAPHNIYLSILVEQGLVGMALFGIILLIGFLSLRGLPPPERRFWLVLLGTWCICGFALNWEWRKQTWLLLVLVVTHASALLPLARGKTVGTQEAAA